MFKLALIAAIAVTLFSCQLTDAALVGERCSLDGTMNCTVINSFCLKNSACQQGICQCKTGYITLFGSNTDCFPAPKPLSSQCLDNAQCGQLTQCAMGVSCQCLANYRPAADGINCLKGTVMLGGNCTSAAQCGTLTTCHTTSRTCVCSLPQFKPSGDSYSCSYLTFGETCTVGSSGCDPELGLQCLSGTCQCPTGSEWKNVTIGQHPARFQCVSTQAIFTRTYGQDCHDLYSNCGNSGTLRACSSGLMCKECPEDAETCIRKCLIYTDTQTTPAPSTTTAATTTTTTAATTTKAASSTPGSGAAATPCWHSLTIVTAFVTLLTVLCQTRRV